MRVAQRGERRPAVGSIVPCALLSLLAVMISSPGQGEDPRWSDLADTDTEFVPGRFTRLEDWERVRSRLRRQILWSAGLWPPPPRSPLEVHRSGRIVHEDYTVEKLRFESFPGLWVCGNLYRPREIRPGGHPGVLNPHGHAATGRLQDNATSSCQARCITFARMGCVAFMWDMVDYNDSARQLAGSYRSDNYWSVHNEHWKHGRHERALWNVNAFGIQLWNGIRALDLLASLPEVDPDRLGVTGASGGGTQTFTLYAVDDRVKVAAPVCMVSAYMQGGCNCENAPGLRIDASNVDFGAMMAPRPLLLVSVTRDWTRHTPRVEYPAIRRIYDLHGVGDRVRNVHLDAGHGYTRAMREAVYPWFARWLELPLADGFKEPEYRPEKSEDLLSFTTGLPPGAIRDHEELVAGRIESIRRQLRGYRPTDLRSLERSRDALGEGLRLSTGVGGLDPGGIEYESEGPIEVAGVRAEKGVLVERGRGTRVPVRVFRPRASSKGSPRPSVVLVSGDGAASLARRADLLRDLLEKGRTVLAVDVFGRGDSTPPKRPGRARGTGRYFDTFNRSDDSERVYDLVVAILHCVHGSGDEVDVLAFGEAGPWAAVAGATLGAPGSQGTALRFAIDANGFDTSSAADYLRGLFIPGILRAGGLPAAVALLAPRPLVLHDTRGRFDRSWVDAAYAATRPSRGADRSESTTSSSASALLVEADVIGDTDLLGRLDSLRSISARDRARSAVAGNAEVAEVIDTFPGRGVIKDDSEPTPPRESVALFEVDDELEIDVVAAEPVVRQPLHMSWDHRGRLWVVQYLQYPFPAGLRVIRYDQHLRAVFDRVPPPPPEHFRGADRITVLEDSDGDGRFDSHKDVITGLNIATAVAVGGGGIWVLNPPYLLFYPDADGDDVPDRDPQVRLRGFGLEDTHSVASSLRWGPDGWLYGVNGSTTTGRVSSEVTPPLRFEGQCVWRYHPRTRVFEIWAEGGGNTFSLEIDAAGRVFSGTNHGGTRGMHYAQGGYAVKSWGKHGPLTNPYAFGFYQHMRHEGLPERFSQAICIYEGGALPSRFRHALIAANSLHRRVVASTLSRDTSTWRTTDLPTLVTTRDRWFRPVDIKVGPDGAVYLADWYDSRLSHVDPRDDWHKASGRIYRLRARGASSIAPFDLSKLSSERLVDVLVTHENRWFRQTALRVLGDRGDRSVLGRLRGVVSADASVRTLDALWALNLLGAFDESLALATLASRSADVRRWGVRLLGDAREVSPRAAKALEALAGTEGDVEVRSQLASSARRLPCADALAIVRRLAAREEDLDDRHIPLLLWWAVEARVGTEPGAVLTMLEDEAVWRLPIVERHVIERLMQRFAMAGSDGDLAACARLLELSPDERFTRRLMSGLEAAFRGRRVGKLPEALSSALESYQRTLGESDLALALRQGKKEALDRAIAIVRDASADKGTRLAYIEILGEIRRPRCVGVLTGLLRTTGANSINRTALQALRSYDDPSIADAILGAYQSSLPQEHAVRATAHRVLASRKEWAIRLLREIDGRRIKKAGVSLDVVHQMTLHGDPGIDALVEKHWGKIRGVTPQARRDEISRIRRVLGSPASRGDPTRGKQQFAKLCGKCHGLFDEGGNAGPDLTGYERDNLDFLLPAIVDPSLAIREEFTSFLVVTRDGRTMTGLIDEQDTRTVTLRDVDNQTVLVARERIERIEALDTSLMPEGIVRGLDDDELRDLFSYLTSRTPGSRRHWRRASDGSRSRVQEHAPDEQDR